jgi:hypothetical protein
MRLLATLISMQMWVAAASAETLPDKVVSLLKEVCVVPTSSEEKMAAGKRNAAKENWKLIRSEASSVMMPNGYGTKNSFESAWEFDLPEGSQTKLYISVLRPEPPDFRDTICVIQPAIDIDADELSRSIDRQFGSIAIKHTSERFREWLFTEEKLRGNCGKKISLLLNQSSDRAQPKTLYFTDEVYPPDSPMSQFTRCPNQ